MDTANPQSHYNRRLRALLREAELTSFRIDETTRGLSYSGRSREWLVAARLNEHWFNAYTRVCDVPEESNLKMRLMEAVLDMNRSMSLSKFIFSHGLVLEIDYRAEHLDAEMVGNLIGLLHANAETYYPKIFRIVSGNETLKQLESSLRDGSAA